MIECNLCRRLLFSIHRVELAESEPISSPRQRERGMVQIERTAVLQTRQRFAARAATEIIRGASTRQILTLADTVLSSASYVNGR